MKLYKKMLMAAAVAGTVAMPSAVNGTVHAAGRTYGYSGFSGTLGKMYETLASQKKYKSLSTALSTNSGETGDPFKDTKVYGKHAGNFRHYTDQLAYMFSNNDDYVSYFIPGVARYKDNKDQWHSIALNVKVKPAGHVQGVALNKDNIEKRQAGVSIIKATGSEHYVGAVDINIKFMSTTNVKKEKDVYKASNNIKNYTTDNVKIPFFAKDIDVGQYFKVGNYSDFSYYRKTARNYKHPSDIMSWNGVNNIFRNKANTDDIAVSNPGHIFVGIGSALAMRNNSNAWNRSIPNGWGTSGSTAERYNGNVYMLSNSSNAYIKSVFGAIDTVLHHDAKVSDNNGLNAGYDKDLSWNTGSSSYSTLYNKASKAKYKGDDGNWYSSVTGDYVGFDVLGGYSVKTPKPKLNKDIAEANGKYVHTATKATLDPTHKVSTVTKQYRLTMSGLESSVTVNKGKDNDKTSHVYLAHMNLDDNVYGAHVKDKNIQIVDAANNNVTAYFYKKADYNSKEGYTAVSVKAKPSALHHLTENKYYVTFDAVFDEPALKAAHKYHGDMVSLKKTFKAATIYSNSEVKNQATFDYEYTSGEKGTPKSDITNIPIEIHHSRPSDVPVEINKYVYANGNYSKNVDENVIGNGKLYNGNDVMTYKIALKFHRTKLDKADQDGDVEKRYFTKYKLSDTIKDMTNLKVVKTETSGGASANASLSGKDLTVESNLSKNNEQTVNIYVSGTPIVSDIGENDIKSITNSAKVTYWSKTDASSNNGDEDAYDGRYNNGQSFKAGKTSNTTKYRVHRLPPPRTTKMVHDTSKYGVLGTKDIKNTRVDFNQKYTYTMSGSTERTGGTTPGKMVITDNDIDKRVTMLSADVVDTDGNTVARWNAQKDGKFYSANGLTIGDHTVTYIGKTNPDKSTKYTINLMVQYTSHTTTKHMSDVIFNKVTTSLDELPYDKPKPTSASVKVLPPYVPPTGKKTTVSLDGGDPAKILNANASHTVKYNAVTTIGNLHDMDGYEITDQLPENTTLIGGASGVKMSFKEEDGYGGWQDGGYSQNDWDISYDKDKRLITARLVKNVANYTYVKATLNYSGTVKDHSDWSDYSQIRLTSEDEAKLSDNGDLILNGKELTGASYIMVPNLIYYKYPDGQTIKGRSWYRVQVKQLDVKQEITQNHEDYTDYLKKSHYLPKTRSDATALTTRINIQMPNYLKIKDFKSSSIPTSKMDKGVVSYKDHSNNDNGDNPDLTGKDLNLPSNLQDMSGREYYYYSKYSPKTKYYESYKKLDHMVDTFTGKVSLTSREDGTENKTTNDVKVKLPNIYSYKDITSVISYPDKTATVTVHGQITGLAVDDNNPTNFDVEEKTYDENGPVTGQVKTSGGYVSPFTQIDLANGIKTGQTALTKQIFKDINVTDLTGSGNSFTQTRTYRSSSTLTEKLGHSVVLTSDNTGDGNRKAPKYQDEFTHDIGTGDKDTERRVEQGKDNTDVFGDDGDKTRNETLIDQRQTVTGGNKTPKDTKLTKPNTTGDIPHETITYYDIDHYKNYVRNMEETYMFTGPDAVSAKAGYGFKDMHVLYAWTYSSPDTYKIKETSIDHIFNATKIKDANSEIIDYTTTNMTADVANYNKAFKESIKALQKAGYDVKTTMAGGNATYTYTIGLDKAKDDDKALIKKNEGIVKTEPSYYLRRYTLRYPKRVLVGGIQSLSGNGSDGGYANYIRDFDTNKSTNLTYTSNSFGTLAKMSVNASQIVYIYGHRSLTKTGSAVSNSRDEIVLNGSLSGKDVKKSDSGLAKFLNSNK